MAGNIPLSGTGIFTGATTVLPAPTPHVIQPGSINSYVYKNESMVAAIPVMFGQAGYSTMPIYTEQEVADINETHRVTFLGDYLANKNKNATSGNLVKTEVIVPSTPPISSETSVTPATPPQTAYDINQKSLNVPSVRNAETEDINPWQKVDVGDSEPLDGKEMPSHLRKFPGIPMFLEMVDSSDMTTRKKIVVPGKSPGENNIYVSTLKLNPNPETLTINSTKKINRYTTMSGWIEEHWGDDIDTVNFNGSTFSFYDNSAEHHYGLTNEFREDTDSYKYLKELIHYYQVNGCIYQDNSYDGSLNMPAVNDFLNNNPEFRTNHPRKGMIKERLYIKLNYDYLILYGRFESFDVIEDSTVPFKFKYSAIFKSERTIYKLDNVG
jgi:hypothetical protein